jgi:hypothetical protein
MAIWRRRATPQPALLDRLFALPSAASALKAELGFSPTGTCSVSFRAVEGRSFRDFRHGVVDWLDRDTEKTMPTETTEDSYGFSWLTMHRPPDRVESLVADLHGAFLRFADSDFGPLLLCALMVFRDRDERQVALIYLYKRGTFYPFAPQSEESRDNDLELAVKDVIKGMWLEPDMRRWFPVWGAPGL